MKRNKSSEDGERSTNYIGGDGEVVWEQCLALLSNVGGISRLTIFNDNWHSKHPEGARLLWGYNSWREAKLYVNVFFGNEVDTTYDPLLSYYLLVTENQRLKLLSWMGSKLATNVPKPYLDDIHKLPLRLAKIPQDCGVVGDKGFSGIEYHLPNCNEVVTPPRIANSKKERLSKDQIESEIPITTIRAPCETVFRRVDNQAVMKEKVPYWIIPWLPHGHALAHGEANLCRPLRVPGRNSIVGDDYWENKKDYKRVQQPSQSSQEYDYAEIKIKSRCCNSPNI